MIYIAVGLVIAIAALRALSPKRYAVHASKAIPLPKGIRPQGRWLLGGLLRDERGSLVNVDEKFIGTAVRDSMASFGIPNGSTFIGDFVRDKRDLKPGDIVVVDGVHAHSATGLRLRKIETVRSDGILEFVPDSLDRSHRQRPADEVVARVTHVVNYGPESPLVGFLSSLPRRLTSALPR